MSERQKKVAGFLVLVLLLGGGIAIGIGLDRLWLGPPQRPAKGSPEERIQRIVAKFRERLSLDATQVRAVEKAFREGRSRMEAIRARVRPELASVRTQMRARIEGTLTAAQRKRYREMVRQYDARRRR